MPAKMETKKGNGSKSSSSKSGAKGATTKTKVPKISASSPRKSTIAKGQEVLETRERTLDAERAPHVERVAASALKPMAPIEITQEMISQRAYEIWMEEGRPDGRSDEHWNRAERELRS